MADGFRAEKLQRNFIHNLAAANKAFNERYCGKALAHHRQQVKMRIAFQAIKVDWDHYNYIRCQLPAATAYYPICRMIENGYSRSTGNMLAKNYQKQLRLYTLRVVFRSLKCVYATVQISKARQGRKLMKRALRILSVYALKRATLRFNEAQLSINLSRHIYGKVFSTLKKRAENAKRLRVVGEQIE